MDCKICGAPAEVTQSSWHPMSDYDGEGLIEIIRVDCAAGHWYTDTGEEMKT